MALCVLSMENQKKICYYFKKLKRKLAEFCHGLVFKAKTDDSSAAFGQWWFLCRVQTLAQPMSISFHSKYRLYEYKCWQWLIYGLQYAVNPLLSI